MYKIEYTNSFKRSFKKCLKIGLDSHVFEAALRILVEKGSLPQNYEPHKLSGKYRGLWECHLQSDWLLIWFQDDDKLILQLIDTGTHSDLFG